MIPKTLPKQNGATPGLKASPSDKTATILILHYPPQNKRPLEIYRWSLPEEKVRTAAKNLKLTLGGEAISFKRKSVSTPKGRLTVSLVPDRVASEKGIDAFETFVTSLEHQLPDGFSNVTTSNSTRQILGLPSC